MTGSFLVAHPDLHDPNFRRTILFLSHHTAEDGAVGFVLNRPLGRTLAGGDGGKAGELEVYFGGPVSSGAIQIASLQWRDDPEAVAFIGLSGPPDQVAEIPSEWRRGLRAFEGYAGWSRGQLESEIAQKAWFVLPPTRELIEMRDPRNAWRDLMRGMDPILKLLAEAPDDPGLN